MRARTGALSGRLRNTSNRMYVSVPGTRYKHGTAPFADSRRTRRESDETIRRLCRSPTLSRRGEFDYL